MCIGKSSTPKVASVPTPPPVAVSKETKKAEYTKAAADETKRAALAKGRSDTIKTTPLGAESEADVQRKALLGRSKALETFRGKM